MEKLHGKRNKACLSFDSASQRMLQPGDDLSIGKIRRWLEGRGVSKGFPVQDI